MLSKWLICRGKFWYYLVYKTSLGGCVMDFSKNLFFARKNKLTIAIKSFILQCGNTHYQKYFKSADAIASFICDSQPSEKDDYSNLADYINQWASSRST